MRWTRPVPGASSNKPSKAPSCSNTALPTSAVATPAPAPARAGAPGRHCSPRRCWLRKMTKLVTVERTYNGLIRVAHDHGPSALVGARATGRSARHRRSEARLDRRRRSTTYSVTAIAKPRMCWAAATIASPQARSRATTAAGNQADLGRRNRGGTGPSRCTPTPADRRPWVRARSASPAPSRTADSQ